jgi:hypothetical protein
MHSRISRLRMKGGGRGRRCRREAGGAFSVGLGTRGPKVLAGKRNSRAAASLIFGSQDGWRRDERSLLNLQNGSDGIRHRLPLTDRQSPLARRGVGRPAQCTMSSKPRFVRTTKSQVMQRMPRGAEQMTLFLDVSYSTRNNGSQSVIFNRHQCGNAPTPRKEPTGRARKGARSAPRFRLSQLCSHACPSGPLHLCSLCC